MTDEPRCRKCSAPIVWQMTSNGRMMPLDPTELLVVTGEGKAVRGRISHFATCPYADEFRRKKEPAT